MNLQIVTSEEVAPVTIDCPNLEKLRLTISETFFEEWTINCKKLKLLSLKSDISIEENLFRGEFENVRKLELRRIENHQQFVMRFPLLEEFILCECSADGLNEMLDSLKCLKILILNNMKWIDQLLITSNVLENL